MLSSVEQAFVGRGEIRAPLKTPAWEARFSLARKHKHKHICKANENWVDISISISTRKTGKYVLLALMLNYVVALTSENWVDMSTSISSKPCTNHKSL